MTVTQLQFSPVADHLLSVSRDRSWAVHALSLDQDKLSVTRTAGSDKRTSPHKRIIWTCCWSADGAHFFTGSRDKLVVCWELTTGSTAVDPLVLPDSVTALAASHPGPGRPQRLAVGLDSGLIHVYSWNSAGFQLLSSLNCELAHHLTVTRLAFSPTDENLLASASLDHALKIYTLKNL